MITTNDRLKIKKMVCKQHFQWYDETGVLWTVICETVSDEDDIWSQPCLKGKCLKCHDIDKSFDEMK